MLLIYHFLNVMVVKKTKYIAEIFLFAFVTLIFLYKLDYHYFFTDEILYVQRGIEQIDGTFDDTLQVPPLVKYIAGAVAVLFNENIYLMRFVFALAGIASAAILYLIVKREFGKSLGILAVLTYCTSRIIFDSSRMVMLEPFMHLFWLGFHYFYYQTFTNNKTKLYIYSGILIGLALTVKVTSLLLLLFISLGFIYKTINRTDSFKSLFKNYLIMGVFSGAVVALTYLHMFVKKGFMLSVVETLKSIRNVYMDKSSEGKTHVIGNVVYEKSPWWAYFYYHFDLNGLARSIVYPVFLIVALVKRNFFVTYWFVFLVITFMFHQFSGVKNVRYFSSVELSLIILFIAGFYRFCSFIKSKNKILIAKITLLVILMLPFVCYLKNLKPTEYLGLYIYFKEETADFTKYKRLYVFGSVRSMKWYRDMVPDKNMFIYRRDYEIMCSEFGNFDYFAFDRQELMKDPDNLLYKFVKDNSYSFEKVNDVSDMDVYKKVTPIEQEFECPVLEVYK